MRLMLSKIAVWLSINEPIEILYQKCIFDFGGRNSAVKQLAKAQPEGEPLVGASSG